MAVPDKTATNGRGPDGRFLKGNPGGPGRPRGIDFRRVIAEQADSKGIDLEEAMWRVFTALLKRAEKGDVPAARLLLDRTCDVDAGSMGLTIEELVLQAAGEINAEDAFEELAR